MVGGMLMAAAGVKIAEGQQTCAPAAPSISFEGTIGKLASDSRPSKLVLPHAHAGSPNIIYIVLDDCGYSDLHCFGSEVSTPHIDSLASGGLQYTCFHSKAICSPSRAALLTGRNSHSVGMAELPEGDRGYPHTRGRITPAAATVAQILRANGYSTLGVGKWHLTPHEDMNESGSRSEWPLQKGFDRWYGFLSGWTDQYHPDLIEDNHALARPNQPGYHFSVDIVDKAMKMVDDHVASGPGKPFFLHVAFGATHFPLQVPKPYIDKYVSTFQVGWDQIRENRYKRQLELGVIPAGTKLPPRNPGDPAWNDLSDEARAVFARFMADFAGFLEHADEQIGHLIEHLKDKNLFDNTVIFLISDNGGAPEAGVNGSFYHPYGGNTTVHEMYQHLDELGTDKTEPGYQRPWAMASDTPFKFYKLWPYRGGVQTPMIVSWPKGIQNHGFRRQFIDIIDITPTVLDIVGVDAPDVFQGVCQIPLQGKSVRATFNSPDSASPRNTQYFELWGSRGIYHDGWTAIGMHKTGTSFDADHWELYHEDADFSQSTNLAAQYPEKVREMMALWWSEAKRYGALPLLEPDMDYRKKTYDQFWKVDD
jgi:arylsulfatase